MSTRRRRPRPPVSSTPWDAILRLEQQMAFDVARARDPRLRSKVTYDDVDLRHLREAVQRVRYNNFPEPASDVETSLLDTPYWELVERVLRSRDVGGQGGGASGPSDPTAAEVAAIARLERVDDRLNQILNRFHRRGGTHGG